MMQNNITVKKNLNYEEAIKIIESKIRPYVMSNVNVKGKHFYSVEGIYSVLFEDGSIISSDKLQDYYKVDDDNWEISTLSEEEIKNLKYYNIY